MKVYVATEGSYSDYHILGVFSREEDAREVGEVEAFDLYDKVPKSIVVHSVRWWPESPATKPDWQVRTLYPWDYGWENVGHTRRPTFAKHGPSRLLSGTNRSLVEKAFQDRQAQEQAEREGIA